MKCALLLCLMGLVTLSMADTILYPRGCIYILGKCMEECPVGTHAYATGCNRKLPEATCEQPEPQLEEYMICDYSACYCDPPTVRNTKNNKCVPLDQCDKE